MTRSHTLRSLQRSLRPACAAVLCAVLAACAGPAMRPDGASDLRARLTRLQGNPDLAGRAPLEMKAAEQAVLAAEQPSSDRALGAHLVFMADRKISIAEADARERYLVDQRPALQASRDRILLDARTREANTAGLIAADALADASRQRQRANQADSRAQAAEMDASNEQKTAAGALLAKAVAEDNTQQMQSQLDELNARVTDRGTVVTLGDLLFAFGTADLNPGGHRHLDRLAAFLNKYPSRRAAIEGYTDNVGGTDYNLGLSQRRADAVKAYLVSQGISDDRLTSSGKGKSAPIGDNSSSTGRQQNRRVEVVIANQTTTSN